MSIKKNNILIYALIFIEILVLYKSKEVISSIVFNTSNFFYNIFPSLFINMIIGSLIVKLDISCIMPKYIYKLFNKYFNLNNTCVNILISSIICGSPSNAIFIKDALEDNKITNIEALKLLNCTLFINPVFIINIIGIKLFNNIFIGILIIFIIICINVIKLYFNKNSFSSLNNINTSNNKSFVILFTETVNTSIKTIINILGTILIFNILITLISNIFNLSSIFSTLINIILEITSGITKLNSLLLPNYIKFIICITALLFGGLSIRMQNSIVFLSNNS